MMGSPALRTATASCEEAVFKLGSRGVRLRLASHGFAKLSKRVISIAESFATSPHARDCARQRISSCAHGVARGEKNFVRENSGVSQADGERTCGGIVFGDVGRNGGDGAERAGAFL